jgi:hypothetical protein
MCEVRYSYLIFEKLGLIFKILISESPSSNRMDYLQTVAFKFQLFLIADLSWSVIHMWVRFTNSNNNNNNNNNNNFQS